MMFVVRNLVCSLMDCILVIIVVTSTVGDYIHRKHKFSVYF